MNGRSLQSKESSEKLSEKQNSVASLWGHLHWLTVLAQQGSFTAAAARLHVSKAAMSQRIAELEKAAGMQLVRRTTRSVRLTEAGRQLVESTQGAFEQISQSFEGVRDLAESPRGTLRITAPVAFARQQLMPSLAVFLREHPEVHIELDLSDRLSALAVEGFDLAIRHTTRAPDTHVAWTLCDTHSVLVATKAYLRKRGSPSTPEDLAPHDTLAYPRPQEKPVWTFEKRTNRITVPIRGPFAANNSEALRDAALAGLGIALLPDFSAQTALRSGKLVQVLSDWQPMSVFGNKLFVIRPYSTHVPRAAQALIGHLRGAFNAGFAA